MDNERFSLFETLESLEELSIALTAPLATTLEEEEEEEEEDSEVLHICDGCSYQTENVSNFVSHVEENDPHHHHSCLACSRKYKIKSSLSRHISQAHRNIKFVTCESCDYKTYSVESLQEHKFSSHLSNVYSCLNCEDTFDSSALFVKHLKSHPSLRGIRTGQKIVKKSGNPENPSRKEAKLVYVDFSANQLSFKCKNCEYRSNSKNSLQRHFMRNHNKTFQCKQCPFKGSYKTDLWKHTTKAHGREKRQES